MFQKPFILIDFQFSVLVDHQKALKNALKFTGHFLYVSRPSFCQPASSGPFRAQDASSRTFTSSWKQWALTLDFAHLPVSFLHRDRFHSLHFCSAFVLSPASVVGKYSFPEKNAHT